MLKQMIVKNTILLTVALLTVCACSSTKNSNTNNNGNLSKDNADLIIPPVSKFKPALDVGCAAPKVDNSVQVSEPVDHKVSTKVITKDNAVVSKSQ